MTIVASTPLPGAEMRTFLAPPLRCSAAWSRVRNLPVDSMTTSTPYFAQYRRVREEATRLGMPLIAWACPRGSAFEASGGGANSFYAVDYAARVASELGADIVKVKFPHPEKRAGVPARYDDDFSPQQAMAAVVRSANRTLVMVSGGSMAGEEAMLEKARQSLEAGATGLTFGRNIWQREHDESLRLIGKLQEIMLKHLTCSIASWERRHGSFGENMIFPS